MARTRNVSVRISTEGVSSSMEQIEEFGEQGSRSLGKIERGIGLILKASVGFIAFNAALNGVRNVIGFLEDAIESAGRIADVSDQLAVGAEALQRWELSAKAAGIENEQFESLLGKLNVKLGEARQGNQKALESFEAIGVSWADLQKLNTEQAFLKVADAISKIEDPAQRAALLGDLVGDRLGPRMQAFIAQGGQAIDDYGREWAKLGGVLDDQAVKKADEVGDALSEMGSVLANQAKGVLIELLPAAETIREWTRSIAGFFEEAIDGFRRFFGLAPDFDDTLDQIKERALELVEAKKKLTELDAETERVAREQPGARLALEADKAAAKRVVDEIEGKLGELRANFDKVTREQRRLKDANEGVDTGLTLPPPSDRGRGRGKSEADRLAAEAEREAAALQSLRHQLDPLAAANDNLADTLAKLSASDFPDRASLMAAAVERWAKQTADLTGETKAAEQAQRAHDKVMAEGRGIFEETRTAAERYEDTFERLTELWRQGAIDNETFGRAVAKAGEELEDATEGQDDLVKELTDAFEGFGRRSAKALADVVVGLDDANVSAENLLQTLGSEVLEQLIFRSVTGPLAEGIGSALEAALGSGGGGWWGFADGGVLDRGRVMRFANGTIVRRPTLFPMADGMGLMGEAGPEAVMPVTPGPDGRLGVDAHGVGGVVINIIDQRSGNAAPVERRERQGRDGRREIDLYIRDSVNRQIAQGGFDDAMGQSYGLGRQPQVMRG